MRSLFDSWLEDGRSLAIRVELTLAELMSELDPGTTERAIPTAPRTI